MIVQNLNKESMQNMQVLPDRSAKSARAGPYKLKFENMKGNSLYDCLDSSGQR